MTSEKTFDFFDDYIHPLNLCWLLIAFGSDLQRHSWWALLDIGGFVTFVLWRKTRIIICDRYSMILTFDHNVPKEILDEVSAAVNELDDGPPSSEV